MTPCGVEFETLSAFVDGELDPREELDLRRHIERCNRCRSFIETLLGIKAAVASTAEVRPVPHYLRERVSEVLTEWPTKQRVWALLIPSLVVAATIVFAAVIYRPMFGHKANGADRLTRAMVEDHIHYLAVPNAIQVATDDPQQIAQAFADQFGFRLELPVLPGANLLGGRLCWLHGRKAVLTFYLTSSGRFSLFVLNQNALPEETMPKDRCSSSGRYEVCLLRVAPELLAMVGDRQQTQAVLPLLERFGAQQRAQ